MVGKNANFPPSYSAKTVPFVRCERLRTLTRPSVFVNVAAIPFNAVNPVPLVMSFTQGDMLKLPGLVMPKHPPEVELAEVMFRETCAAAL